MTRTSNFLHLLFLRPAFWPYLLKWPSSPAGIAPCELLRLWVPRCPASLDIRSATLQARHQQGSLGTFFKNPGARELPTPALSRYYRRRAHAHDEGVSRPAQEDTCWPGWCTGLRNHLVCIKQAGAGWGAAIPGHSRDSRGFTFMFYQQDVSLF